MMLLQLLPASLRKYFTMSRRERKHEIQSTLWYMPLLYVSVSVFLVVFALFLDIQLDIERQLPPIVSITAETTQMLVSTLIGGILTLSAFTLNSLLVVLTTFSGQFSPRMLLNFVADRRTQHALGVFNGSFVYVLLVFLFIGSTERENFAAVPITTIFLAFLTAMTFIYFINHATTWMQVHNITNTMKENSQRIIKDTLSRELEVYRAETSGDMKLEYEEDTVRVQAKKSGYVQLVDYRKMLEQARRDDIIVQFHRRMGEYVLAGNELFSYWGPGADDVEMDDYSAMVQIGHKELELQDLQMGMYKLSEIAIKSIGNKDPKTAMTTMHQMAELMLEVVEYITFTPYLQDENGQTRIVLMAESFESYLYKGFGFIRHYAEDDHVLLTELINCMAKIAESLDETKQETIWAFASDIFRHQSPDQMYRLDLTFMLESLQVLSRVTDSEEEFKQIEERMQPV
ncbi:DUF2254 domain-containing protein [Alkalicoccus luteus]|nr:DUF2254 domain-containing protein [Alkalicoccus luteus]